MIGDADDMARRMAAMLPNGWFGDIAPNLKALLAGFGTAFSLCYGLIQFTIIQTRVLTATASFLDLVSCDYFGTELPRLSNETDASFRARILFELMQVRATRTALITGLELLTGRTPVVFEPARPQDTGSYSAGGAGYCIAGGWGNLELPFQFFLTAFRPSGGGIAELGGYSVGGIPVYGNLSMAPTQVNDSTILSTIVGLVPTSTTAWVRISN